MALLRVLVEAGSGGAVTQAEAGVGYQRRSALWTAPEDQIDTVVGDLADWGLVVRIPGAARSIHPTSPTPIYEGSWSARPTDDGRDFLHAMPRLGR